MTELFDAQVTAALALTTGVGVAMVWTSVRLRVLELRHERRRCPACGVILTRGRECTCSR